MDRFEVRDVNTEFEQVCSVCKREVFKESDVSSFCSTCSPRIYFCESCKTKFVDSHPKEHGIGTYYKTEEVFIEYYKKEIETTCNELMKKKKYSVCIKFCQKALRLNLSAEIALYSFKIGMLCHFRLYEYTESKKCAKTALKIIEKLKMKDTTNDLLEITSVLCRIYIKLENPKKCLFYGVKILRNFEAFAKRMKRTYSEEYLDDIKLACGNAFCYTGKFEEGKRLLEEITAKNIKKKNYVDARVSLSLLLDGFRKEGTRNKGLEFYNVLKKKYPKILEKDDDLDVSFVRLKKSVNKLKVNLRKSMEFVESSVSIDGKIIDFNKQHYLAIIDNDYNTAYSKLSRAIEAAEDLISTFPDSKKIEPIVKKRIQLVQRMYCCCILRKKPFKAFQWAERGKSFMFYTKLIKGDPKIPEKDKGELVKEKIDVKKIIQMAKKHNVIFIQFVVVQEIHFSTTGDFIDIWIINPRKDENQNKDIIRTRLTHKPLEIVKVVLELYTEINKINDLFESKIQKKGFKDTVRDIKKWQLFNDKLFQIQLKNKVYDRFTELLEEMYCYLIIPIQQHLPFTKNVRKRQDSSHDLKTKIKKIPTLSIIPDEFISFIPFPFLKKTKREFFIDSFCVTFLHSIKIFEYNLSQLKHGRENRRNFIMSKLDLGRSDKKSKRKSIHFVQDTKVIATSPFSSPVSKEKRLPDKISLFGLIFTDVFSEYRKTELLPIYQLFNSCIKESENYNDTLMVSNTTRENMENVFKIYEVAPKIVHIANCSIFSGKNLPTFQKELQPVCGFKLTDKKLYSTDVEKFNFSGTEVTVLSHFSSIAVNESFDGLNDIHRSIIQAGCPSILYPLFEVSEFFSTLFLIQFYKHLLGTDLQRKKSKGEAYRHAIISSMEIFPLLRKCPFFLSSFQFMGESVSIFEEFDLKGNEEDD